MASSILVLDPNPGFAGMVQQALQEAGYDCLVALTNQEALRLASTVPIDLAILDLDLQDMPPEEFVRSLRALQPTLALIGIPPDNDPHHPLVETLGLQAATTKPFYMPDFLPLVKQLLEAQTARREGIRVAPLASPSLTEIRAVETPAGAIPKAAEVLPSPLQDPRYAQNLLASLAQTISATGCLLSRSGQVWAAFGDLQPAEVEAAAQAISESWSSRKGGVVVRYLSAPSKEEEYLLYSTSAPAGLHLTLVFDTWQPSARMRAQAKQILVALEGPPAVALPQVREPEAAASWGPREAPETKAEMEAPPEPESQGPVAGVTRRLRPEDIYTMGTRRLRIWPETPAEAPGGSAKPPYSAKGPGTPEGSLAEVSSIRLIYHLVLAPADENLRLVPEVASDLEGFTRNLVVSLGCRPTRVSAHPDYLLVSLSAPATVLPSLIVGHLRSMTTDHLLGRFPSLVPQSRTGDFWARLHLLTTQEQPPTPGQVANFLSESHPGRRPGRSASPPSSPL
ncbi:MAG: transposase [Anaerolineales bacterium]|jgi:CheY-like chemotaxis protein/REP element-mobilizing transposase RayT